MASQPLVLVADDEPRITKLVAISLSEDGFRVITASNGEEALRKAEEYRPDVVLLDIVMPDIDGIEVMGQLREGRAVPVILLTAKGSTADKAKGLDLGADDYIAKPFHPDELAARIRAVLRRSTGASSPAGIVRFDDVEIDLERRMVMRNGELVQLSRTEWLLLQHLAANAGKVVLHTELLTKVWGPEYRDDLQYLRVWVSRVRRKLGASPGEPGRIKTFQGIGYLLDVDAPAGDAPAEADPARPAASLRGRGRRELTRSGHRRRTQPRRARTPRLDGRASGFVPSAPTEERYQEWRRDRPVEATTTYRRRAGKVPIPGRFSCEIGRSPWDPPRGGSSRLPVRPPHPRKDRPMAIELAAAAGDASTPPRIRRPPVSQLRHARGHRSQLRLRRVLRAARGRPRPGRWWAGSSPPPRSRPGDRGSGATSSSCRSTPRPSAGSRSAARRWSARTGWAPRSASKAC